MPILRIALCRAALAGIRQKQLSAAFRALARLAGR